MKLKIITAIIFHVRQEWPFDFLLFKKTRKLFSFCLNELSLETTVDQQTSTHAPVYCSSDTWTEQRYGSAIRVALQVDGKA